MGHEVVIYGPIQGATGSTGNRFRRFEKLNRYAVQRVPGADGWPWVVRGVFALPVAWATGAYRTQVIHFGLSLKDFVDELATADRWLTKFESVLRCTYWSAAVVHWGDEVCGSRTGRWVPTEGAPARLRSDAAVPVARWVRTESRDPSR